MTTRLKIPQGKSPQSKRSATQPAVRSAPGRGYHVWLGVPQQSSGKWRWPSGLGWAIRSAWVTQVLRWLWACWWHGGRRDRAQAEDRYSFFISLEANKLAVTQPSSSAHRKTQFATNRVLLTASTLALSPSKPPIAHSPWRVQPEH